MVEAFGDLEIEAWVAELEHDLVKKIGPEFYLLVASVEGFHTVLERSPAVHRRFTLSHFVAKIVSTWKNKKFSKLK